MLRSFTKSETYNYYKKNEKDARVAAMNGEYLKAERLFLDAARARLFYRDRFYNGQWDDGHKARYDICVGSAWIQREAFETEVSEKNICYERQQKNRRGKWSVWRAKIKENKSDNFESLMKQHEKIKQKRRNRN